MSFKAQVLINGAEPQLWVDCYPRFKLGLEACQYIIALGEKDDAIADFQVVEDSREPTHRWDGTRAVKLTEKQPEITQEPSDVPF